jgi:hypothetical protein
VSECLSEESLSEASKALAQARRSLTGRDEAGATTPALWAAVEAINAAQALLQAEQSPAPECRREQLICATSYARSAVVASRYAAGER